MYLFIFALMLLAGAGIFYLGLRKRHIDIWLVSYLKQLGRGKKTNNSVTGPVHIMFCFVDHYEPLVQKVSDEKGMERVERWMKFYPPLADSHLDSDGVPVQHTYFYPQDEYREGHVKGVEQLCRQGYGELEIHIHHRNDTDETFSKKMTDFIDVLVDKHDALSFVDGKPYFGFIHGNWALDNSRPDGDWCGVNNELIVLDRIGCYADFTLPSAPSDTQTSAINQIYYATDDPCAPKSHDTGTPARQGVTGDGDLLIVQGPLTLNWKHRAFGIWPRIENGDVAPSDIPIEERVDLWVNQAIHVEGRPEWQYIKVHTHGALDENSEFIFEQGALDRICHHLENHYNDGERYVLHYVNSREIYNMIKATEDNKQGNPNNFRDYILPKPSNFGSVRS